jgi:HlyD family secretion protein
VADMFRKVSLERLSSPEQLDLVMEVTQPRGWMALAASGALVVVLVIWGFVGSIPERVDASGILLKQAGISDVAAPAGGQVVEVTVNEGDDIKEGQVIARLAQPEATGRIRDLEAQLAEVELQQGQQQHFTSRERQLRTESVSLQRQKLEDSIKFLEGRLKSYEEQLASSEKLLERGLVTRQSVLQLRDNYFRTQDQIQGARTELRQISTQDVSYAAERDRTLSGVQARVNDLKRQIEAQKQALEGTSVVKSPHSGRVLERRVDPGDLVRPGTSIVSVQLSEGQSGLRAIVYIPPAKGKNVRPGMDAQVSPSTAKREEFGYLHGKVHRVAEFPSTREGMLRVLPNPDLVASLSGQGAPFAAFVDLEVDPSTESGFRWSSRKGATQRVGSGTLAQVTIVVRERRPIEMVIPLLREYTGI